MAPAPRLALVPPVPPAPDVLALHRAHGADVARWAGWLGGPGTDVDQVCEEVFLAAHAERCRVRGDLTGWLFRLTLAAVRGRRRPRDRDDLWWRRWRRRSRPRRLRSLDALERERAAAACARALGRLGERPRALLVACLLDGRAPATVAGWLGIPPVVAEAELRLVRHRLPPAPPPVRAPDPLRAAALALLLADTRPPARPRARRRRWALVAPLLLATLLVLTMVLVLGSCWMGTDGGASY